MSKYRAGPHFIRIGRREQKRTTVKNGEHAVAHNGCLSRISSVRQAQRRSAFRSKHCAERNERSSVSCLLASLLRLWVLPVSLSAYPACFPPVFSCAACLFPLSLFLSLRRRLFLCPRLFPAFRVLFRRMLFVRSDFSHFLFFAMTGRPRDGILERPVPLFLYSFFVFHVRSLCDMLFSLFYHLFILLIRYLFICSVVLIFISGSPLLTC